MVYDVSTKSMYRKEATKISNANGIRYFKFQKLSAMYFGQNMFGQADVSLEVLSPCNNECFWCPLKNNKNEHLC